jgi:hypothetical protein
MCLCLWEEVDAGAEAPGTTTIVAHAGTSHCDVDHARFRVAEVGPACEQARGTVGGV